MLAGIFVLIQIFALFGYLDKTNRDLADFFQSIRFSDFSRTFQHSQLGGSFDELKEAMNSVIVDFQKIRSEKEEHFYYLQNIIQHVGVSIIAYQKDGTVEMINNAAKKMFQVRKLENINALTTWSKELVDTLLNIETYQRALIKVKDEDEYLQLVVHATEFKINDRTIILVSIKNIQAELEEKEMEAWQKLIRVLTHEIMNSIAPIASLTSTMKEMIDELKTNANTSKTVEIETEALKDIKEALLTINKRSTGLIHFVETYRNLTRIPTPNFTIFPISSLFQNIEKLFSAEFEEHKIKFNFEIKPETLELTADEQLIEQVLINLIRNSIQAFEKTKEPKITVSAHLSNRGRIVIQVFDNGQGIISEVAEKIFIPFFTTKPKGSGIGLSLSKQILRLHGGTINVNSTPDKETIFTLTL